MRVGVLELLTLAGSPGWIESFENRNSNKQYASIMPQAIAVWCRQLGHKVSYATFWGQRDPRALLPDDLDIVFIGCSTQSSGLAYALAKLYRRDGVLTVMGGPHAKSFPHDGLRFFDIVVTHCDKPIIVDILSGGCQPGTIVSSGRVLTELPTLEERMPEVRASIFSRGKPSTGTTVPFLSSVGCPYSCNFCTDWDNPYVLLPMEYLAEDLRFMASNLPGVRMAFHDPNFGVKFDQTLEVLERLPQEQRNPYVVESSLSLLRGSRLQRLQDTNCFYIAPGIESWSSYSNKAGVGTKTGSQKVQLLVKHLEEIHERVPGIQVNFILGLDGDSGDEPFELTKEFLSKTPFAWPVINIPIPFGGTPLYDEYLEQGRILRQMPFTFYYFPHLVTTLRNYDPAAYYRKLIGLVEHYSSPSMMARRFLANKSWALRSYFFVRTLRAKGAIGSIRRILDNLNSDEQFRAFHEGRSETLPEFYHREYERLLGPYAPLMSRADRVPELVPTSKPQPFNGRAFKRIPHKLLAGVKSVD